MEFNFDIKDVLQDEIIKLTSTCIPPRFSGDRSELWDTERENKLTEIIDTIGDLSAIAQGLTKTITTTEKLKNSDHTLYILIDPKGGKARNGVVMGFLKMGPKGLYVFDRNGEHHKLQALCVLDFYVHESLQRKGLGKKLFEHMLQDEKIEPAKLAIDRPSDKFLGFLKKHYKLVEKTAIPQMNSFVVFDGFFTDNNNTGESTGEQTKNKNRSSHTAPAKLSQSQNGFSISPYGRYGAPRPSGSMAQLIYNQPPEGRQTDPR